jgi:hypothetical protein
MTAYLVVLFLVLTPDGPAPVTIVIPWSSVEHCQKYLEDPAPIGFNFGLIPVLGSQAFCKAKVEKPA